MTNAVTPRKLAFAAEYVRNGGRAMDAAVAVGYSAKSAKARSHILRYEPGVAAEIERLQAAIAKQAEVAIVDVVRELMHVGFSNVEHYQIDEDGHVHLAPDAPKGAMRAVSSVKRKVRRTVRDGVETVDVETEFRLWDKNKGLELLGKHLGAFDAKKAGEEEAPLPIQVTVQVVDASVPRADA